MALIAKILGSTSSRYRSDAKVSNPCRCSSLCYLGQKAKYLMRNLIIKIVEFLYIYACSLAIRMKFYPRLPKSATYASNKFKTLLTYILERTSNVEMFSLLLALLLNNSQVTGDLRHHDGIGIVTVEASAKFKTLWAEFTHGDSR